MPTRRTNDELLEENEQLSLRLSEAEGIVNAIRSGAVDAVIVSAPGESVYMLEGAERPYRLLVEAMQQAVAVLNVEGVLLYCNPCFETVFATPLAKLIGKSLITFVSDDDQNILKNLFLNAGDAFAQCEVRLLCDDGTTFPVSFGISILPLQKLCLLVTDLRQQRLYDELLTSKVAMRESEIRYRRLFETAKDGILILDAESGRITDANPFMSELLGYAVDYFSGKELWEIGLFSDRSVNEAAVRELQDRGYLRYEHLPLETSAGSRVEVEVVANSYREDDHRVIQCNIRDITERSLLESERNRLEISMREQSTAMEDLHRRKDEFLAMLSHELRNPLSPIASALQLLGLQKNEDRLQHQARTIIERQVGQLTRLIDDLLEVSRITTGRIHLQQKPITVNGILENAIETVRPLLNERQHEFTASLSPQPIWLFADAARMEQVVVNLLTNAAKFTDNGGHISLSAEQAGDECVIRVRDTGVGIAPELLPYVFDLFTQSERSLDRSQGGLGIGLALVQRLVENHGGHVEVHSVLGHGCEFVVHIPVMVVPETRRLTSDVEATEHHVRSLKIMVVDDNEDAAEMLGMLLLSAGHDVLTVHDGPSTLVAALDFRPDVVLLDIGLPGLNGYEVATKLRQQTVFQDVVLVAMTGYGQDSDRKRSHEAGFDHHLVKPPDFNKLTEILSGITKNL